MGSLNPYFVLGPDWNWAGSVSCCELQLLLQRVPVRDSLLPGLSGAIPVRQATISILDEQKFGQCSELCQLADGTHMCYPASSLALKEIQS